MGKSCSWEDRGIGRESNTVAVAACCQPGWALVGTTACNSPLLPPSPQRAQATAKAYFISIV